MSVLVGWRCSSGRAQRCRRETSINQSAMPCLSAFPLVTAFGLRVADRQVGKQMPRAPSAAFAFCLYRRRYGNNSQHEPSRVPVRLSPATSLLRCLRGAAKQQFNLSRSLSLSVPDASGASGGRLLRKSLERGVRIVIRMRAACFDFCRD